MWNYHLLFFYSTEVWSITRGYIDHIIQAQGVYGPILLDQRVYRPHAPKSGVLDHILQYQGVYGPHNPSSGSIQTTYSYIRGYIDHIIQDQGVYRARTPILWGIQLDFIVLDQGLYRPHTLRLGAIQTTYSQIRGYIDHIFLDQGLY